MCRYAVHIPVVVIILTWRSVSLKVVGAVSLKQEVESRSGTGVAEIPRGNWVDDVRL